MKTTSKTTLTILSLCILTVFGWAELLLKAMLNVFGFVAMPDDARQTANLAVQFLQWMVTTPWWVPATIGFVGLALITFFVLRNVQQHSYGTRAITAIEHTESYLKAFLECAYARDRISEIDRILFFLENYEDLIISRRDRPGFFDSPGGIGIEVLSPFERMVMDYHSFDVARADMIEQAIGFVSPPTPFDPSTTTGPIPSQATDDNILLYRRHYHEVVDRLKRTRELRAILERRSNLSSVNLEQILLSQSPLSTEEKTRP